MKKTILTLGLILACAYAWAQGIGSAKDLQEFIDACNSGASLLPWSNADSVVVLTADIDLSKAKNSVVISCPRMSLGRQTRIAERLVDLAANGLDIVLYTKEDNDDALRLKNQGISVMIKERLSLHTAIIDKSIIWYGSVNILGFHSIEDNLIRFKNSEIATSLLESLR